MKPELSEFERVLDVGGWYEPAPEATHVVDLFPWETRYFALTLDVKEGERYTQDSWHQMDFVNPKLHLPFPDKFFDFSVCSHVLEDLPDPRYIIAEMIRVSKAGYIEVPSRLHEQTLGVRDRAVSEVGYRHHHWIIDLVDGNLLFHRKAQSHTRLSKRNTIPLKSYERLVKSDRQRYSPLHSLFWEDSFGFEIIEDADRCTDAAESKVAELDLPCIDYYLDSLLRFGRRLRDKAVANRAETEEEFEAMVRVSSQYSKVPLELSSVRPRRNFLV